MQIERNIGWVVLPTGGKNIVQCNRGDNKGVFGNYRARDDTWEQSRAQKCRLEFR